MIPTACNVSTDKLFSIYIRVPECDPHVANCLACLQDQGAHPTRLDWEVMMRDDVFEGRIAQQTTTSQVYIENGNRYKVKVLDKAHHTKGEYHIINLTISTTSLLYSINLQYATLLFSSGCRYGIDVLCYGIAHRGPSSHSSRLASHHCQCSNSFRSSR